MKGLLDACRRLRILFVCCVLGVLGSTRARASFTVSTTSISFGTVTVGMESQANPVTVTNTGATPLTITGFRLTPFKVFQLEYGWAPNTLLPSQVAFYAVKFVPDSPGTLTGQFSLQITGASSPVVVSLSGTAITTSAVASVSPPSLTFASQPLGTTSPGQTVTVTNTGTGPVTLETLTAPPPFNVNGLVPPANIAPGDSVSFQVTFLATEEETFKDTLVISYDVLPSSGVGLSGTVTAASSLGITTFPSLPSATQKSAYLAMLQAVGGTGQLTWSLFPSSRLPRGLTLSSLGTISGSLASGVAARSYPFTVEVADSSQPPKRAISRLILPVGKPTGASCSNITWDVAGTSSPIAPLNDLGTGTYLGSEGGLYPDGTNARPTSHDAAGVSIAQAIQPLNAHGKPDPNGLYALLSIGISNTRSGFSGFLAAMNGDPAKNTHLVLVNGAIESAQASLWADPTSGVWSTVLNNYLPYAGVTANQVVAAWVMVADSGPTGTFPTDMAGLKAEIESIAQNLHTKFPNLVLAYFTSRYYGGYSNGINTANPEPFAYESGFAVKWAIEDQLAGNPALNFDPTKGPVMAPWLSWGPYDWANGLLARSDGLVWTCQDLQADAIHPSPLGRDKETSLLVNFFKSDDTTTPWFLAP